MLNGYLAKAAAILLLFSFPATMLPAQTPAVTPERAGVLYPQEGVTVKGNPVFTSTAVYAGDEIQTGKLSTLLTGEGVSLQLKPHTALKFGKAAELGCGGLVLVTRHSIPVRLAGIEVVPSGSPTKLEVDNAGGTATLSVKSGTATVSQGGADFQLAGRAIHHPLGNPALPGSGGKQQHPGEHSRHVFPVSQRQRPLLGPGRRGGGRRAGRRAGHARREAGQPLGAIRRSPNFLEAAKREETRCFCL